MSKTNSRRLVRKGFDQNTTWVRNPGVCYQRSRTIPRPAHGRGHLAACTFPCLLHGNPISVTSWGPQLPPPPNPQLPSPSDTASGWGWSLLRLLPPPLGSPLSGSLKQGGNGPEPKEADVGWGGPAPRSPQIPTWLQHKQPSSPTRSLPGDLDKQLMRQRDHRGPSKSHSNLAWLYFYALISIPSQVGKKQKLIKGFFIFKKSLGIARGRQFLSFTEKNQIGPHMVFCQDGNVETLGKKQRCLEVKEKCTVSIMCMNL